MKKETVCVWDGFLTSQEGYDKEVQWEGVWMPTETADPKTVKEIPRNAFKGEADAALNFAFAGMASLPDGATDKKNFFQECTLDLSGKYDTDTSDGNKAEEANHQVLLSGLRWAGGEVLKTLCFGCGKNDVGSYIEAGWMKPGNRIVMARRYVDDDRAKWTLQEVKKNVLEKIYDEKDESIIMPPWHCDTFNG